MRRRPPMLPLDRIIIGARKRLTPQDSPASQPKAGLPLSDKERSRLNQLNTKHMYAGPLSPAEYYERQTLQARKSNE